MPEAGHQTVRGLKPSEELVEVVDADGRPTQVVTRAEMRAGNLRHRATYVVVHRPRHSGWGEEVLVHQRAAWKDIWPNRWDIAFGGVCDVGEPWLAAAQRELAEEAGVVVEPGAFVAHGPVRFESCETRVVGRVFSIAHDGPFTFPDGEVVAHDWVRVDELRSWTTIHPLCADSAAVVLATACAL